MHIHPSRLSAMGAEVETYARNRGWYDEKVPLSQGLAWLHEEISGAGRAWRRWGLADATAGSADVPGGSSRAKPEGVGSEFADILMLWLDGEVRFSMGAIEHLASYEGAFGIHDNFLTNINVLHDLVSHVSWASEIGDEKTSAEMADVLVFLFQLCDHCGIDLYAEYERKMRYNRDRPYKHGRLA